MSVHTILLFFGFFLGSCATLKTEKKEEAKQENYSVQLAVQTHTPYCGGAYPTPEMAKGSYGPQSNQKYLLIKGSSYSSNADVYQSIQLDGQGAAQLSLPVGDYLLVHPDKKLSYDAFLKKHQPSHPNEKNSRGDACFEKWYNSPDFIFHVASDTTFSFTQSASCFTGTNPCLIYTGPYPP